VLSAYKSSSESCSKVILSKNEGSMINYSDILMGEDEVKEKNQRRYFEFTKKTLK